jgi:hypothetical protein
MLVRLTRKLANCLDGVDLSHFHVGDLIEVPRHDAQVLMAEGWAEPSAGALNTRRARLTAEQLHCVYEQMQAAAESKGHRRAEDRIRDELRDSRAKTIHGRRGT